MRNIILIWIALATILNAFTIGKIEGPKSFFSVFESAIDSSKIKIETHKYFTKGFRIIVDATIRDDIGIYEARVYFKHSLVQNYQVYSTMTCMGNRCSTELPLTDLTLRELDYVVVYQNSAGNVYKSNTYTMQKRDLLELPSWQSLRKGAIKLYTDYAKPMQSVRGFSDNITIEKSSGDPLGVDAELYPIELITPEVKIDCSMCIDKNASNNVLKVKR